MANGQAAATLDLDPTWSPWIASLAVATLLAALLIGAAIRGRARRRPPAGA